MERGTPKGIVEGWEKGRYLQNREADALLRSLNDRETLERRAGKAGVQLPELTPLGTGGADGTTDAGHAAHAVHAVALSA